MKQYLDHSKTILSDERSRYKPNRTGIDTISLFGYQNEHDLSEGFPLVTTKKIHLKSVIHELIWFMRGDGNIKYLLDNGINMWNDNAFEYYLSKTGVSSDELPMYSSEWKEKNLEYIENIKKYPEFAKEHGTLGPIYGVQWRHWKTSDGREIDQFGDLIENLKKNPASRRHIVSAWNPEEIPRMALPPCHTLYHLNVVDGQLDLQLYQRSCDMFLGVPFNIASYATLTNILAKEANLEPGRFIHTFGDSHFYCGGDERGEWYGKNLNELKEYVKSVGNPEDYLEIKKWVEENAPAELPGKEGQDHVTAILEQLSREPKKLPKLEIADKPFDELEYDDFKIIGYKPHPLIKRAMAV